MIVGERYSEKAEAIAYEAQLRRAFELAGLRQRVHWLGYRTDVSVLLRAADLLIHPARQEPFGRVLLEAASSGLAIVATHVGGTTELLTDLVTARLIPPDDAPALAAAVTEVLGDATLRNRLGTSARRRVESEFSIDTTAGGLLEAWRRVIGR